MNDSVFKNVENDRIQSIEGGISQNSKCGGKEIQIFSKSEYAV